MNTPRLAPGEGIQQGQTMQCLWAQGKDARQAKKPKFTRVVALLALWQLTGQGLEMGLSRQEGLEHWSQ